VTDAPQSNGLVTFPPRHYLGQATDGYHRIGLTRISGAPRSGVVHTDLPFARCG